MDDSPLEARSNPYESVAAAPYHERREPLRRSAAPIANERKNAPIEVVLLPSAAVAQPLDDEEAGARALLFAASTPPPVVAWGESPS